MNQLIPQTIKKASERIRHSRIQNFSLQKLHYQQWQQKLQYRLKQLKKYSKFTQKRQKQIKKQNIQKIQYNYNNFRLKTNFQELNKNNLGKNVGINNKNNHINHILSQRCRNNVSINNKVINNLIINKQKNYSVNILKNHKSMQLQSKNMNNMNNVDIHVKFNINNLQQLNNINDNNNRYSQRFTSNNINKIHDDNDFRYKQNNTFEPMKLDSIVMKKQSNNYKNKKKNKVDQRLTNSQNLSNNFNNNVNSNSNISRSKKLIKQNRCDDFRASGQNIQFSRLLLKNNILPSRCLSSLNIPLLQQKYSFSRFQLFNLYTSFSSLVKFSLCSIQQFKKGIQSLLYLNKITLKHTMIQKCYNQFLSSITFQNFLKVFGNIQNMLYTENVMNMINQMFKEYHKEEEISYDQMGNILKNYVDHEEVFQIRKEVWETMKKKDMEKIEVKEVLEAFQFNMQLCRKIQKLTGRKKK